MELDFPTTERRSTVRVIAQRGIPEQPMPYSQLAPGALASVSSPPIPNSDPTSSPSQTVYQTQMLATFDVIAKILSTRIILLLSVLGGFVMAYLAMANPINLTLATAAIYNLTVIGPLIWLTATRS